MHHQASSSHKLRGKLCTEACQPAPVMCCSRASESLLCLGDMPCLKDNPGQSANHSVAHCTDMEGVRIVLAIHACSCLRAAICCDQARSCCMHTSSFIHAIPDHDLEGSVCTAALIHICVRGIGVTIVCPGPVAPPVGKASTHLVAAHARPMG